MILKIKTPVETVDGFICDDAYVLIESYSLPAYTSGGAKKGIANISFHKSHDPEGYPYEPMRPSKMPDSEIEFYVTEQELNSEIANHLVMKKVKEVLERNLGQGSV